MAFSIVQRSGVFTEASGGTITLTFSTPPAVGNAVVVLVTARHPTITGIGFTKSDGTTQKLDNKGNVWVLAQGTGTRYAVGIFWCSRLNTSGAGYTLKISARDNSTTTPLPGLTYFTAAAIEITDVGVGLVRVGGTSGGASNLATANPHMSGTANAYVIARPVLAFGLLGMEAGISSLTPQVKTPPWIDELTYLAGTYPTAKGDSRLLPAGYYPTEYSYTAFWTPGTPNQTSVGQLCMFEQGAPAAFSPDVIGMDLEDAWAVVDAVPMERGKVTFVPGHPPLQVVAQGYLPTGVSGSSTYYGDTTPLPAGVWLPTSTQIDLSVGMPTPNVPNLVGMTPAVALAALDSLYLRMGGPMAVYSPTAPLNTILTQTPAPGTPLTADGLVETTVATREIFPVVLGEAMSHHTGVPGAVPTHPPLAIVQETGKKRVTNATSIGIRFGQPLTTGNGVVIVVNGWCDGGVGNLFPDSSVAVKDEIYQSSVRYYQAASWSNGHAMTAIYYLPRCVPVTQLGGAVNYDITITPLFQANMIAQGFEVSGVGSGMRLIHNVTNGDTSDSPTTGTTAPLTEDTVLAVATHAIGAAQSAITVESLAWLELFKELPFTCVAGEVNHRFLTGALGTTQSCSWEDSTAAEYAAALAIFAPTPLTGAIGGDGPHVVQTAPMSQTAGVPTITTTFPATPVTGHGVVVTVTSRIPQTASVPVYARTANDNYGNVYTLLQEAIYGGRNMGAAIYWCRSLAAVGPGLAVTVTTRPGTTALTAAAIELDCPISPRTWDTDGYYISTISDPLYSEYFPAPGVNGFEVGVIATDRGMADMQTFSNQAWIPKPPGYSPWLMLFTEYNNAKATGACHYREVRNLIGKSGITWVMTPEAVPTQAYAIFLRYAPTTHTFALPAGVAAGDLLLMFIAYFALPHPYAPVVESLPTTPSGWTVLSINDPSYYGGEYSLATLYQGYMLLGRHAMGTEGSSVNFVTPHDTSSSAVVYRITGHKLRMAAIPVSIDAVDGTYVLATAKRFLWLSVLNWIDGRAFAMSPPRGFGKMTQSTDSTATGIGVAGAQMAANTDHWPPPEGSGYDPWIWKLSPGVQKQRSYSYWLEYYNDTGIAVWPEESDLPLPLTTTAFSTKFPVLKQAEDMFQPGYIGRPPSDDAAIDPDYPWILESEAIKTVDMAGVHTLTQDLSSRVFNWRGDWTSGEGVDDSYIEMFEIGNIGPDGGNINQFPPGHPQAGNNATHPVSGWWNAADGRITVDVLMDPQCWDESTYHTIFNVSHTSWWWGTLTLSFYKNEEAGGSSRLYTTNDFMYVELLFLTDPNVYGYQEKYLNMFNLPREEWINKRARFRIDFHCATHTIDPADPLWATAVGTDGFITMSMQELPTGDVVTLYNVQRVPMTVWRQAEEYGMPGVLYLSSGSTNGWDLEAITIAGVPLPEEDLATDMAGSTIGLTWVEWTLDAPVTVAPTMVVPATWDIAPRRLAAPRAATPKSVPIYSQNWAAGNSLFSSMGTYNASTAGVDPLYPQMKSSRAVYVNPAGHLDRNPAITADGYDDGRVLFDGIGPLSGFWNANEGVATTVQKPNATSESTSYYSQLLILSDWALALWYEGQGESLLTLECQVFDGTGTDYNDYYATYTFTPGTTYTISIEWRCALQNPTWTDSDTSGWVRVLINGSVVFDIRNLKLCLMDTSVSGYASYTYNRAKTLQIGNGLLGEHFSVVLEDVVADPPPGPTVPTNTTCETAAVICGTLPRTVSADLSSYFLEKHPLWYVLLVEAQGTVEIDFTGTSYGHTIYVYRGTDCATKVQTIDTASGNVSGPLKLRCGMFAGATYFLRVEGADYEVATTLMMTVRDGRLAERAVIGVAVQGNTNAVLGPGNGIQSAGAEEIAWTLNGDLLKSPLVRQSNPYQYIDRNVTTSELWASTSEYNGISRFTPDMGLLETPVPTVNDGRYTSGVRLDDAGRLYRIQWPVSSGSGIAGRVTRINPPAAYADAVLLTLPSASYTSTVRGSGMCPSRDGSFFYLARMTKTSGSFDITTIEWVHKYSEAGAYLGTFCHLPGSGTLTPSIVMDIYVHPVTGDVFVSADKYKFYFPGGPGVELVAGGSLLHYNASGTLLHTWFDTPWQPITGPRPSTPMYRLGGVAVDIDDPDILWVSRERLQLDAAGNAIAPIGSLAKVRISTGAVISDANPHGYYYGYSIAIGGLGPMVALAACAAGAEVPLDTDMGGTTIGLTWVEWTTDPPVVS